MVAESARCPVKRESKHLDNGDLAWTQVNHIRLWAAWDPSWMASDMTLHHSKKFWLDHAEKTLMRYTTVRKQAQVRENIRKC